MKKILLAATVLTVGLAPLLQAQRTIRIIYGSTTNVRNSHGGNSNTNSLLSSKSGQLRDSDRNTNTGINWTRPSHFRATYNNRNQTAATQLNRVRTHSGLGGFRNRRDSTNSDLAQLFCDWTNAGVLGAANQPGAFSVMRNNTLGVLSVNRGAGIAHVHETAHNMNANHAHGHCYSGNRRTAMYTAGGCGGSSAYRNVFSSPTRFFEGRVTGNNSNNNRTRIRNRRNAAANLR